MGSHAQHVHPTDDVSIDYFAAGEGPGVVLVHGITESRRSWDPLLAPLLAAGYRVVVMDLRGHGDSSKTAPYDLATMAGDVAAVVGAEGLDSPLLIGHSLGGAVVTAAAGVIPTRGVINVDQPLQLSAFQDVLRQLEPMLRGSDEEFQGAITAIFDSMAGQLTGSDRQRVEMNRAADQDVVLGAWDAVLTMPAADLDALVAAALAGVEAPYLSLHGIDPGPDYGDWLASNIDGAVTEVWPDVGHYPHLVDPQRFLTRVIEFDPAR